MRVQITSSRLRAASLLLVAVLAAGCASGGASSQVSSAAKITPAATGVIQIGATAAPTSTPSPISGDKAAQGAAEFCTKASAISAQLPATIPLYPGARLKIAQNQSGNSLFGACSSASTDSIAAYYASQLPGKGWQQVQGVTISDVRQVTGVSGSFHVVVTVEPDALAANTTEIIIAVTSE